MTLSWFYWKKKKKVLFIFPSGISRANLEPKHLRAFTLLSLRWNAARKIIHSLGAKLPRASGEHGTLTVGPGNIRAGPQMFTAENVLVVKRRKWRLNHNKGINRLKIGDYPESYLLIGVLLWSWMREGGLPANEHARAHPQTHRWLLHSKGKQHNKSRISLNMPLTDAVQEVGPVNAAVALKNLLHPTITSFLFFCFSARFYCLYTTQQQQHCFHSTVKKSTERTVKWPSTNNCYPLVPRIKPPPDTR